MLTYFFLLIMVLLFSTKFFKLHKQKKMHLTETQIDESLFKVLNSKRDAK